MIKDLSSSFLVLGNREEIDMNMQLVRQRAGQITDGNILALFHFLPVHTLLSNPCTQIKPSLYGCHIYKFFFFFTQMKAPQSIVSQTIALFLLSQKV